MYKLLFRNVYTARNYSASLCAFPAKCDKATAPIFRVANGGVKSLSTGSVRLCEKKSNDADLNKDEKTNDTAESPASVTQKADDDNKEIKMSEQKEEIEPVLLKTAEGGTQQQQVDVIIEQVVAMPKQVKSGKESLLDLLGAMKVKVTNKRKLKELKLKPSHESMPQSKPEAMESTISMFQKATVEASSQSVTLDPELVSAVSAAASTLPNSSQAESELLKQLRKHENISEAQKKGDMSNLGVIIADMKIGKKLKRQLTGPANQIRFDDDGKGYTQHRGIAAELDGVRKRRNLYSRKRLNIFSPVTDEHGVESTPARPTLWDMDFANQMSLSVDQTCRNGLEEMIQWTKEGKMWQYPINNEAGLEEEASVPFHEHIFLDEHIEEGFPRQGPVRHFMELVVAGLSKNPYLMVQQKREHISWFRDYFQQKEEVLKEADVYLN